MRNTNHINHIIEKGLFAYTVALPEFRLLVGISLLNNAITVLSPFFLIFIMSKIWFINDPFTYLKLAVCFITLGGIWLVSSYIRDVLFYKTLYKYSTDISMETTRLLVNLPYSYIGNLPVESQYNRFMPLENISYIWLNRILKNLLDLPLIALSLGIICFILGFVYFSYLLLIIAVLLVSNIYNNSKYANDNSSEAMFHGNMRDYFGNIKLIRRHNKANEFCDKALEMVSKRVIDKNGTELKKSLHDNLTESLLISLYVFSLGVAVYYALMSYIDVKLLIVVLLLTWFSIAPIKQLLSVISQLHLSRDIVNQFRTLVKVSQTIHRHKKIQLDNDFYGDVTIANINYQFGNGSRFVINNASFSVRRGEVLLITGPSGAGKSTLLKMVMGLEQPLSGFISVDHDINLIDKESLRGKILYLSSKSYFENLSILENLSLSHERGDKRKFIEELKLLDLKMSPDSNIISKYNVNKFKHVSSDKIGFQEIVNKLILSRIPPDTTNKVILVDEPLLHGDKQEFEIFVKLINQVKHNNTVIIATRYSFYNNLADKFLLIKDGKIQKYWGKK